MKPNNNLAWGISLISIGVLFLLKKTGILPASVESYVFDWRNILLLLGLVFVFAHKNKGNGVLLLIIWALLYFKDLIHLSRELSEMLWPLLLIVAGGILIINNKKNGKR